ncbi:MULTISPECIES: sigma-54 interaction domain-containing protein [Aneurinibacillus]|uniref:Sigma 54-interacting transcriptional regulator n=1 Tax=Aneurinibacillus thermoaerophilus TaxID=143495 RepID=A0ABX8YEC8_ANETH|nr:MULTISPECIES: sigma 54-interacting transcriptional regulator [Aneurinibacillus]MED0677102.1 sigma 54-interacting transcriptional regulator [Aneurinibacillus thermoaerophilus]MED0679438.1 sigma 54-interacting transcriptional regulator [Aneurinibacillus thermoaerophilus]MED0737990.1 sigma 54-interacting transcriptional regulator [Aneurinibacillus thermoaerophilus]MED0756412.1 sigma 54-interacting transcriptional regulator [Aneurinibacillus thermoaerophilus]MED0761189.1 sigma 54-interacting tr
MIIRRNGWVHRLLVELAGKAQKVKEEKDMLQTIIDHAYEGVLIVDPNGYILMANEIYANFLGWKLSDMIGKHVTEVIENTRMHIVGQTGKPEIAQIQKINGREMIASRIPVFNQGKVAAVVGTVMFQEVDDLFALTTKVENLRKELNYYKDELDKRLQAKYSFDTILGTSEELEKVKILGRRVAKSDTTILLKGESGTGKELFAHAIHRESYRSAGPLIKVNCAAIPDTLLESELFGYKGGSFTGAKKSGKKGKFALAKGGTIFLDEISEMPLMMQAKLLRVLQEKEIEPIGADKPESVDVRIIAATNKDLLTLVEQGKFRHDLYYRLNVVMLEIPPLRERSEDIPLLIESFLQQLEKETGIRAKGVEDEAMRALLAYSWPGNIRELRNVLERALYVKNGEMIALQDLPPLLATSPQTEKKMVTLKQAVEKAEAEVIRETIRRTKGDKIAAARQLGISKSGLYVKLARYGLNEERYQ